MLVQEEAPRPAEPEGIDSMLAPIEAMRNVSSERDAYFQLGLQLRADQKYAEAFSAFELSSKAPGAKPASRDILLLLAHTGDLAGERPRAFRAWLDLAAAGSAVFRDALLRAARHLTPSEATAQEAFVVGDWLPRVGRHCSKQERAYLHSFVGVAYLCMGLESDALSSFSDAALADSAAAREFVPELLGAATLLPTQVGESLEAHYLRARIFEVLGDLDTALSHCAQALEAKPLKAEGYPQAPVYELRGKLAEASGDSSGASRFYFLAGQRYGWRDEHPLAVKVLERACALDETSAVSRWQLSDMLLRMGDRIPPDEEIAELVRTDSSDATPEEKRASAIVSIQRAHLRRGLREWEAGASLGRPTPEESWVYLTRAFMTMNLADRDPDEDRSDEYWEGAALGEQGLLLGPREPLRWSNLSFLYRSTTAQRAALQCCRQGFEVNPDSPEVLEELAINLTNLGYFDEAAEILAKNTSPWNEYVLSQLCLYGNDVTGARTHIQNALAQAPGDLGYRWTQGLIQCVAGEPPKTYEEIASEHGANPPDGLGGTVAFALYATGRYDEALRLFGLELLRKLPASQGEVHFIMGLAHLALGRIEEATQSFGKSMPLLRDLESLELCRIYLQTASRNQAHWPRAAEAGQLLESRLKDITAMAARVRENLVVDPRDAAIAELESKRSDEGKSNPWCAVAATAGIARLKLAKGDWKTALENYRVLAKQPESFMEAARGIAGVVDAMIGSSDEHLKQGDAQQAMAGYAEAIRVHEEALPDAVKLATLKLCFAHASARCDRPGLRQLFEQAIQQYRDASVLDAGAISADLLPRIHGGVEYRRLDQLLSNIALSSPEQDMLGALRHSLQAYLDRSFVLAAADAPSSNMYSTVTAIAFEICGSLAPSDSPDDWPLFAIHVQQMRQRFEEEMGVTIPKPRVRIDYDHVLPDGSYLIMLHEVPIVLGTVKLDHCFVLHPTEALAKLGVEGEFSRDPATNAECCWVSADEVEKVLAAGLGPCLDAHAYIARHLEALLKVNLAHFTDAQEIQRLIDEWSKEPGGADLIRDALPDDMARLRFGRLIRALLEEGVSVRSWRDILEVVREHGIENNDVAELLIAVRLKLQKALVAMAAHRAQLELPASLEEGLLPWLTHSEESTFLAIPPEQTQEALGEIRELLPQGDNVLIVRHPEIRQSVRRLVQMEFPGTMVASLAELHVEGPA